MRALAALALLLAACEVQGPINAEVDPPPGAEDAAEIVRLEWADRLETRALDYKATPPIRWFAGDCLEYEDIDDDMCRDGLYRRRIGEQEIHLLYRDQPSESALAHELLHWALGAADGSTDGDHSGPAWAQVAEIDAALAAAGL